MSWFYPTSGVKLAGVAPRRTTPTHDQANKGARFRFVRKLRVGAAMLVAAACLSMPLLSTPVQAAGSPAQPDIIGCFAWGNVAYSDRPVYLDWYSYAAHEWKTSRQANTNASGCVRFNDISVGYWYTLQGYAALKLSSTCYEVWSGFSAEEYTGPGDTLYRTGTTVLTMQYAGVC